jgi:predicted nucleic acid-binding protein
MSVEGGRQFVDTNIFVYAHDAGAQEKHERARELISGLWRDGNGCLSIQVPQELFVSVTGKMRRPLDDDEAPALIADLASWETRAPMAHDVLAANALVRRHRVSFWDAMILRSAERLSCDVVWSEDLDSGRTYEGIRVVNPFV